MRGFMTHKGIPDYPRAARLILKDFVTVCGSTSFVLFLYQIILNYIICYDFDWIISLSCKNSCHQIRLYFMYPHMPSSITCLLPLILAHPPSPPVGQVAFPLPGTRG